MTRTRSEQLALLIYIALLDNTSAYYDGAITYEQFDVGQNSIWRRADQYGRATLDRICSLLRDRPAIAA